MSAAVLFLLGFCAPARAHAVQIITSASISPISGLAVGGTFAGPDLVFTGFLSDNPGNSFPDCIFGCAPGDLIFGGGASGSGGDFFASITRAGQHIPSCGSAGFPFNTPDCFGAFGAFTFGSAVLPPFTGDPTSVAIGEFSILFAFTIVPPTPGLADGFFSGSGSTIYDLVWQPDTGTWRLTHTEGQIPAVPEPATLLLWGTGGAALGLVRWLKRHRVAWNAS